MHQVINDPIKQQIIFQLLYDESNYKEWESIYWRVIDLYS